MKRALPWAVCLLLALPATTACDGTSEDQARRAGDVKLGGPSRAEPFHRPGYCHPVPHQLTERVASRPERAAGRLRTLDARAIRWPQQPGVWLVAAFVRSRTVSFPGVWATRALRPGTGRLLAVTAAASDHTRWPDALYTVEDISPGDPAIGTVMQCLRSRTVYFTPQKKR